MIFEWLKYYLAVLPNVNFRGALSFMVGIAATVIGTIAVFSYVFDPGSVQMVAVPPDSPLANEVLPSRGFFQLWQLWFPWLVIIFIGVLLMRFSYNKWVKFGSETALFVSTVKDLTSKYNDFFGDGLEVVQNLGNDPLALRILKEAIRQRGRHYETEFHIPSVLTTTSEKLENAKHKIIELAEQRKLLKNPAKSGKLISMFITLHDFQDVADLAYEIQDNIGDHQAQEFQLLYNQIRLEVQIRKSPNDSDWLP